MAAPKEMTTKDISGRYYMNKTQSDSTDEVLMLVCPSLPSLWGGGGDS
jgi:hypothetical protein